MFEFLREEGFAGEEEIRDLGVGFGKGSLVKFGARLLDAFHRVLNN